MRTIYVPMTRCPNCDNELDAVTSLDGSSVPEEGDFTCCLACGVLLRFTENLDVREVSETEVMVLPDDLLLQIVELQEAIARVHKRKGTTMHKPGGS